jgi:FtsP/CotA-like multicopper oxidase with cupredoxin domain
MDPTTRPRTFAPLAVGAAVLALLAAAACNRQNGEGGGATTNARLGATATTPGDTGVLREPIMIRSDPATHVLNVTLAAVQASGVYGTGTDTLFVYKLMKANGVDYSDSARAVGLPGPTFVVAPGDSVSLLLVNNLPQSSASDSACQSYPATTQVNPPIDSFPNCFHGPSNTNIHYHGFHVTPAPNGDDVLLDIPPGGNHQYGFRIPMNQSPGTHWYHPHKHGSVALQVTNGMSGAFLVVDPRTGLDSISAALKMTEHVLAVQQITTLPGLFGTAPGAKTLVNGQTTPKIIMHPGEVQRWRIVDENINPFAQFSVGFVGKNGPSMWDIARDGVAYDPANYDFANPDTVLTMGPGNRLDIYVKAPQRTGTFLLRARPTRDPVTFLRTRRGQPGTRNGRARVLSGASLDSVVNVTSGLVEVVVVPGVAPDTTVPTALPPLPPFLANLAPPADTTAAVIVFTDSLVGGKSTTNPTQFFLGNAQQTHMRFTMDSVYIPRSFGGTWMPMVLGQTQDWVIYNRSPQNINHPFHIHINPFQVIAIQYGPTDPDSAFYRTLQQAITNGHPIWLDVLPLPRPYKDSTGATVPGVVRIRQEYKDFTGEFVMHCHILGHEERGMMGLLQIYAPGSAPTAVQGRVAATTPMRH